MASKLSYAQKPDPYIEVDFNRSSNSAAAEIFKGVDFDSSYCIVGLVQGQDGKSDSLPQYWFVLDDPADMIHLQKDWVFKSKPERVNIEFTSIEIYTLRNKMEVSPSTIIFPNQKIIKSGNAWYHFDIHKIEQLHKNHPLHYHTQIFRFDTFKQYVNFGNGLLTDSNLLFFFEPSLRFEGKFYVYASRTNDPDSPMWAMTDVNKVLKKLADDGTYESAEGLNDTFNLTHIEKTRISVEGPKSLYDKFSSKKFVKSEWMPSPIEMTVIWRD
jgi:hypothetical protein